MYLTFHLSASTADPGLAPSSPVKARHAQMQLYAFNLGALGAMAPGTLFVDHTTVSAAVTRELYAEAAAKVEARRREVRVAANADRRAMRLHVLEHAILEDVYVCKRAGAAGVAGGGL